MTVNSSSIDSRSLDGAVSRVGDRWSLLIIAALLTSERTFSELLAEVDGIAPNILTSRLRTLAREAVVSAVPYQRRPVRLRYALTSTGTELAGALAALAEWGARREGRDTAVTHDVCGSAVEARPWCPTCDRVVSDDEAAPDVWC